MRYALALACLALPFAAEAMPKPGDTLPHLRIGTGDGGLMKISGGDVEYVAFDSKTVAAGKVRAFIYMAGRKAAKAKGQEFINALKAARPHRSKFSAVTIMDLDDCTFGTCNIAKGRLEDRKKEKPFFEYVADEEGKGRKRWGLAKEDFSVFVAGADGVILAAARGKITAAEAKTLVDAIMAAIGG